MKEWIFVSIIIIIALYNANVMKLFWIFADILSFINKKCGFSF